MYDNLYISYSTPAFGQPMELDAMSEEIRIDELLLQWGLSYSGHETDVATSEFLLRLREFFHGIRCVIKEHDLFLALPIVFTGPALKWYVAKKTTFESWPDFRREFQKRFLHGYDETDLYDRLMNECKQREHEPMSEFVARVRHAVSRIIDPWWSDEAQLVKIISVNILPAYWNWMLEYSDTINSLEMLENYGCLYELTERNVRRENATRELQEIIEKIKGQSLESKEPKKNCSHCDAEQHTNDECPLNLLQT